MYLLAVVNLPTVRRCRSYVSWSWNWIRSTNCSWSSPVAFWDALTYTCQSCVCPSDVTRGRSMATWPSSNWICTRCQVSIIHTTMTSTLPHALISDNFCHPGHCLATISVIHGTPVIRVIRYRLRTEMSSGLSYHEIRTACDCEPQHKMINRPLQISCYFVKIIITNSATSDRSTLAKSHTADLSPLAAANGFVWSWLPSNTSRFNQSINQSINQLLTAP